MRQATRRDRSVFGAILHAQCKQLRYIDVAGK